MTAQVAKDGMTFLLPAGSRPAPRRRLAFARPAAAAVAWLADRLQRRVVLQELARLSDHELADIGLTRSDLPRVFDPAFVANRNFARKAGN